jgi:hypothetical protein
MYFYKEPQSESNPDGKLYHVYMAHGTKAHYVCDMIDGNTEEAAAVNKLGLTLRARLTRSRGAYAMLEGEIFNPNRLMDAACEFSGYTAEPFKDGKYKNGYTLLTVTADGIINKYLIFENSVLKSLVETIKSRLKK